MVIRAEKPVSEEIDEGGFVKKKGQFHLYVNDVVPNGHADLPGNALFKLHCIVCEGTEKDQIKALANLTIWPPDTTKEERVVETSRRLQVRLVKSCGIPFTDVGGQVEYDEANFAGTQLVADIDIDAKGFPRIKFDRVWHVDDPAVKDVPKSAKALAMLRPDQRKKPEDFPKSANGKSATGGGTSAAPPQKPALDLNDL